MDLFLRIYLLGFEDITDEDEDDLLPEVLSVYPLDQCSRTSPGNHSTIRRWKHRWLKSKTLIDKHGCGMTASDSPNIKEMSSNNVVDMTTVRDTQSDIKMSKSTSDGKMVGINLKSDLSRSNDKRSQSAAGFSSLSVDTSYNDGLIGPFSAPCSVGWRQQSTPYQTSTPVNHREPRFPFHISIEKIQNYKSINDDQDNSRKLNTTDEDKSQHHYNPKKKMFENWSKFGGISSNLKETTNNNNFPELPIINKPEEKYETFWTLIRK